MTAAGPHDPPPHVPPDVDVELSRQGLARCGWCGGTRPVDCWCTCLPVDEQLARVAALNRARAGDLARDRFREQLRAGRWTDGTRLQVRLS